MNPYVIRSSCAICGFEGYGDAREAVNLYYGAYCSDSEGCAERVQERMAKLLAENQQLRKTAIASVVG